MKAKPTKKPGEVVLTVGRADEPFLEGAAPTPFQIKQILVPIDFSNCSKKALRYAAALAKPHEASITLLYVLPPPAFGMVEYGQFAPAAYENQMRADSERQLLALAKEEIDEAIPSSVFVRTGAPATEIMGLARRMPADLIVLSTHGRAGLSHVFIGSVAERIVQHAPCPVLVVREHERDILT